MKSSGICSHALAVCEKVGLLSQFLQCYSVKKPRLNLTKINLGGKQDRHSVGRKPNQPRKRFKGPMPQSEVVVECQKVFAEISQAWVIKQQALRLRLRTMHLASFKFNPLNARQYPQMSQGMPTAFLLKAVHRPTSMNREIGFLFWNFFMTPMICN